MTLSPEVALPTFELVREPTVRSGSEWERKYVLDEL